MRKILLFIGISIVFSVDAQIIDVNSGETVIDSPSGTYIKDINNTFAPFLGTWKYQNGNEILVIKLEKVTQYYYPEYDNYDDFITGSYSYTTDGGITYVTNTINDNTSIISPYNDPIYSPGPTNSELLDTSFKDELYNKSCQALFTFLPGSTTQMKLKLVNPFRGYIEPETPPNPGFSIPNNIVLTKQ